MEQKETEEFFYLKVVKLGLEYRLLPMEENNFDGKVVGKAKIYLDEKLENTQPEKKAKLYDTSRIVQGL